MALGANCLSRLKSMQGEFDVEKVKAAKVVGIVIKNSGLGLSINVNQANLL